MKAFLLILLFSQTVYGEDEFMTFSFINDSDEKRFYSLQKEVSCPLCEGSSIAGSNAPIAADIKNKIYTEILLGKSDEEILANLRDIFGEEVTYKPSFENNIFLWLFPSLAGPVPATSQLHAQRSRHPPMTEGQYSTREEPLCCFVLYLIKSLSVSII